MVDKIPPPNQTISRVIQQNFLAKHSTHTSPLSESKYNEYENEKMKMVDSHDEKMVHP
jgi:hypothetical protein